MNTLSLTNSLSGKSLQFLNNRSSGQCDFDCLRFIKESVEGLHSGIDKPAAIIVEPIQGEGGTYIPKEGWLEKLVEIARKNGILVIFDEIQVGFYRTGKLFASEHTRAVPDIVTMSKGIGGIGLPLSLILFKKELDIWEPGLTQEHSGAINLRWQQACLR